MRHALRKNPWLLIIVQRPQGEHKFLGAKFPILESLQRPKMAHEHTGAGAEPVVQQGGQSAARALTPC